MSTISPRNYISKEDDIVNRKRKIIATLEEKLQRRYFDNLEYTSFKKSQFINYLFMMAECGIRFEVINQSTIDSLDTILREFDSYSSFMSEKSEEWIRADESELAFKYLFDCRNRIR